MWTCDCHHTHGRSIRTDIDDLLMTEALRATGAKTKKAAVEEGLRLLVRLNAQRRAVEEMMGLGWEGDLDKSRQGRDYWS